MRGFAVSLLLLAAIGWEGSANAFAHPLLKNSLAQVEAPPASEDPFQIELPADPEMDHEPDPEAEQAAAAAVIMGLACYGIVILICIALGIFVIYLLYTCYERIPPPYRQMEPGMVWLMLVPLFNIVWNFFVIIRLSRSFRSYFAAQQRIDVGDCGETLGLWALILGLVGCFPVAPILMIIYLVKVVGLRNQIPKVATY